MSRLLQSFRLIEPTLHCSVGSMSQFSCRILSFVVGLLGVTGDALAVDVEVNLNVRREVGGISEFDRSKFITIHSTNTDGDWGDRYGPNFTDDLLADFVLSNDVYFGRDTGYITGQLRKQLDEDPVKPGWASVTNGTYSIEHQGQYQRNNYDAKTELHAYEDRSMDNVIAAQFHPFWPDGTLTARGWALSQTDTASEPFGSASGNYMGHFLNHYYGSETQVGKPLPLWVEVMNEPDWPLFEASGDPAYGTSSPAELWKYHNSVADQIHRLNTNVLVGGYCPAFPDPERDDFEEWTDEWVSFIDTCGTNLDFYTIHLYDIDQSTKKITRRGSFTEALFDMIEHYSQIRIGKQLPFVISEYAGKDSVLAQDGWSALHDWKRIKSMSGYLMSFMDRPNLIGKTIPYIMIKQEWARNDTTGIPGGARLMRREDEIYNPTNTTGDWVYTEHVKWYQLWSDVNGTRVDTVSADPDIQVDAYVDSNKVYLILNNMETSVQMVDLTLFENFGNAVQSVREKNLYWDGSGVVLDDVEHAGNLDQVELGSEGTAILEYTFAAPLSVTETSEEVKYYATTYFQPIIAGQADEFVITNVAKGAYGEAVLRLGAGRDTNLSRRPVVLFNGSPLNVSTDFLGHEGDDRDVFFGQLDIPVPYELLQPSNTVSITYPDSGGTISSVTLRAFEFSIDFRNSSGVIPIDYYRFVGSNIILGFTNGPADSFFSLYSKTNLTDSTWIATLTNLPTSGSGSGEVTNSTVLPVQFFRLVESATQPVPGVIEFAAPHYSDGALDGQQSWHAESGWTVDSTAGHASTPDNSSAAVLTNAVQLGIGGTYSLSINLQFGGTYSIPTNYVYAFLGGLKDSSAGASVTTGSTAADANIQIYKDVSKYRLLNNWSPISGCSTITGELDAGDVLQFDYELTLGSDAASTTYTVRLQNLTDGADTGTGSVTGVDASIYSALTGSGACGFFQSINPGAHTCGLSGIQVNSMVSSINP